MDGYQLSSINTDKLNRTAAQLIAAAGLQALRDENLKFYRIAAIVLGSSLFMPISCTVGTLVGIPIVAWMDSRNVESGDNVHSLFSVVAETKKDREQIRVLNLSQVEEVQNSLEPVSFIMSEQTGNFTIGRSKYTYKVLEEKDNQQMIEVVEKYLDGDNTIWSNYRATENTVFPIKSRMFYFGYMFNAFFMGLVFCIVVYIFGKILKRNFQD